MKKTTQDTLKRTKQSWLKDQYGSSSNLNARIALHAQCSVGGNNWFEWIFDQIFTQIPGKARILEIGGGSGGLWVKNHKRIPARWEIVFTDLTDGMLNEAKDSIGSDPRFSYQLLDASKQFPFDNSAFDVVVANHMLYHIQNPSFTINEIHRVLTNEGIVFATTLGNRFRDQIHDLLVKFNPDYVPPNIERSFSPTSGGKILSSVFSKVEFLEHKGDLMIREENIPTLIGYISSFNDLKIAIQSKPKALFVEFLQKEIESNDGIHIAKEEGMFIGNM